MQGTTVLRISLVKTVRQKDAVMIRNRRERQESRYFGGTLLGTGGLVRAYSGATKEGLANSSIITKEQGKKFIVDTDYNGVGKLQYIAANMQITIMDTQYTDKVIMTLIVPLDKCDELKKKIVEATAGKAEINDDEQIYFAMLDGEPVIF